MSYTTKDMLASLNANFHDDRVTSEQYKRADDFKKSLDDYHKESERIAKEKAEKLKKAQEPGNFLASSSEDEKKRLIDDINDHLHFEGIAFSNLERNIEERQNIEKLLDIQRDKREQVYKKLELAKSEGDPDKIADTMEECEIINKNIATYEEQLKAIE